MRPMLSVLQARLRTWQNLTLTPHARSAPTPERVRLCGERTTLGVRAPVRGSFWKMLSRDATGVVTGWSRLGDGDRRGLRRTRREVLPGDGVDGARSGLAEEGTLRGEL